MKLFSVNPIPIPNQLTHKTNQTNKEPISQPPIPIPIHHMFFHYLLDRDRESELSRDLRSLDDLPSDLPPAPANAGARGDALPWGPSALWGLDPHEHLPEQLLRHVGPAALAQPVGDRLHHPVLHRSLRPRPHVLYYAPYNSHGCNCYHTSFRVLALALLHSWFTAMGGLFI